MTPTDTGQADAIRRAAQSGYRLAHKHARERAGSGRIVLYITLFATGVIVGALLATAAGVLA